MQKARVQLEGNGHVKVDAQLRTSAAHIWAVGDVVGRREQTPVALMEGMAFARFCFGSREAAEAQPIDYAGIPAAVCTPLVSVSPHVGRAPWWCQYCRTSQVGKR